jgi:hypothetical protein
LELRRFKAWLSECGGGTDAVYDGTKPKTFNWEGSVGLPFGKVIDGDVDMKKEKSSERKSKRKSGK